MSVYLLTIIANSYRFLKVKLCSKTLHGFYILNTLDAQLQDIKIIFC